MDEKYPSSKFILTIRDSESWIGSQLKDKKRLEAVLQKAQQQAQAKLQSLQKQTFDCPVLAKAAAQQLNELMIRQLLISSAGD